ncbi:acyl-CoA synthetase [Rhabdothermincola salaria]|uniref:acyl-CoA synthetase n=1 Tax=Rhabdothermincola salaria TaxID=2903142 RepID=UPI001E52EB71|nr:acyl-CoA synthetase [Rhabdothermincola salaria]MCD9625031.1 acyl-CoA synthetase [Rhabdothermincola salaria]
MAYNFADMFEHTVDTVPDRVGIACEGEHRTLAQLEDAGNRLAHHLIAAGVQPGDHVGIYGLNSIQWVEALLGVIKARAVPVNINFRYVADELRYLFDNADLVALFYDAQFGPLVADVRDELPLLKTLVRMDDGSGTTDELGATDLADALAANSPERDFGERSGDDQVIIYTGGTTGMPKGVMWRSEDIFYALAGGIDMATRERVPDEYHHARQAPEKTPTVMMNIPPLMHGAAFVGTIGQMLQGNTAVLLPKFDPYEVWRTIEREKVNAILIVGDAMARPMIEAWEDMDAKGETPDISSLFAISSTAAIFSQTVKDRYLDTFPNLIITDSIGSTEGGFNGTIVVTKGEPPKTVGAKSGGLNVNAMNDTHVLDDDLNMVEPGSGVIGRLARGGNIPLGYYKDEKKTAETFVIGPDGNRYSIPGDFATIEADGTITLLGRGSVCINTGGEKVYPEEVEQVLKSHPAVYDCLVVGITDDRWGQKVTAVVQPREGASLELEELAAHAREHLAGYKVPRTLHLVDSIQRSPSGKPDYPWAKKLAEAAS